MCYKRTISSSEWGLLVKIQTFSIKRSSTQVSQDPQHLRRPAPGHGRQVCLSTLEKHRSCYRNRRGQLRRNICQCSTLLHKEKILLESEPQLPCKFALFARMLYRVPFLLVLHITQHCTIALMHPIRQIQYTFYVYPAAMMKWNSG